jgi:hypothetical protein
MSTINLKDRFHWRGALLKTQLEIKWVKIGLAALDEFTLSSFGAKTHHKNAMEIDDNGLKLDLQLKWCLHSRH